MRETEASQVTGTEDETLRGEVMEIKEMQMSDIEARKAEIRSEMTEATLERLTELNAEADELEARKAELQAEIEERAAVVEQVVEETAEVVETRSLEENEKIIEEVKTMTLAEVRKSNEYVDAFANYIKSENDAECRALLSENATAGTVPVPEMVEDIVRTAWENEEIMSLVKKASIRGNLKVGYEVSADGAVQHEEGVKVDPENLVLATVTLIPKSIKKIVVLSDEAKDLTGAAFLQYIYNEIAHQIAKKAADLLVADIEATAVPQTTLTGKTVQLGLIAEAIANISDQATNPVVIMKKATYAEFKTAQYGAGFSVDPFEGCKVVFNNSLDANTICIVGDLGYGAMANFPNGEEIGFKMDENTLADQDLVRIIGRMFVGIGVVAPHAFCICKK